MNRRGAIRTLAAASAGPFFAFAKSRQANLLFLCSDQHQAAATGCYGHHQVLTPHIDEIASEGIRFERAYCQAPVCVASRGSIITGDYPSRHGARILDDPLPEGTRTVAHFFSDQGYATGAIGKMHFVDESRRHGFAHRVNAATYQSRLTRSETSAFRQDQGAGGGTTGRPSAMPERLFRDTFYSEEAVRFLRENRDRPFCLWASFFMPHTPLVPHQRYWDLYDGVQLDLPDRSPNALETGFHGHLVRARERGWYQQTDEQLHDAIRGYYGNVSQMDANVGRVFDTLRELGLDRNTVVVYTSDHGEMAGAHRMWTKHNMYEQSVRVPLIIRTPDRLGAGSAQQQIVEQADLFPTLAELCGFDPPSGIDGRSIAPSVRGEDQRGREFAYSEYYFCRRVFTADDRFVGRPPILMVRTNRWKLNYLSWERSELFDLENDPGEFRNAIDDPGNSGIVRELEKIATTAGHPA
ncbi:MAG: sulfatase-like hydrolase/transferase [Bryobacterales bacterium]|nr:sulfatase-like hydrolase/transferase [Bryobacterales bacterium]